MGRCTLPFTQSLGRLPYGGSLSKATLDICSERLFKAFLAFSFLYNQDRVVLDVKFDVEAGDKATPESLYLFKKKLYSAGSFIKNYMASEPSDCRFIKNVIVEPDGRVSVIMFDNWQSGIERYKAVLVAMMKKTLKVIEDSEFYKSEDTPITFINQGALVKHTATFTPKDLEDLIAVLAGDAKDELNVSNPIEIERNALMQKAFYDIKSDMSAGFRYICINELLDGVIERIYNKTGEFEKKIMTDQYFDAVKKSFGKETLDKTQKFLDAARSTGCFYEPEEYIRFRLIDLSVVGDRYR